MFTIYLKAAQVWHDRDADYMAAAVSYYAMFAVVPLVLLSVTLANVLYSHDYVVTFLTSIGLTMGIGVVTLIETATQNLAVLSESIVGPLVGAVFFSGMVVVLCNTITSGIHKVWGIPHQGFRGWVRKCWNAIVFIAVFELYLVGLMAVAAAGEFLASDWYWWGWFLKIAFFVTATTILFSLAYRILPWQRVSWRARLQGVFTASLLLLIVKLLVGWYVSVTPFPGLFEAAGLLIVFLMWVYFSVCVFFYGAAVAHILEQRNVKNTVQ